MKQLPIAIFVAAFALTARAETPKPYTRNVAIVVYEDAEPLDWAGPFEVYNDAAGFAAVGGQPAFNVYIVSKTAEPLNAQGLRVVPNYSIANAPKPDIVLFPGGPTDNLLKDPAFFAWSKEASLNAEIAQSVCTGAFVLGKAGLLDKLDVTTWFGAIDELQRQFPSANVKNGRRFVDNGRVVTTAGISAGIDGSLHIVARLLGRRVADSVARYMEYHWTPEAYLARQYSYLNPSTDAFGRLLQTGEMQLEEKQWSDAAATFRTAVAQRADDAGSWSRLGLALRKSNEHAAAADAYAKAATTAKDHRDRHYYNAACEAALAGRKDDAVAYLQQAYAAGFGDRDAVNREPALASLRGDARVQALSAAAK